jgi:hypothetical protein
VLPPIAHLEMTLIYIPFLEKNASHLYLFRL